MIDVSPRPAVSEPTYLGDSVYAVFDGYHIRIYLSNGISTGQDIALEPEVIDALLDFRDRCFKGQVPPAGEQAT